MYCTHPLIFGTRPPPGAMPRSLQQQDGRCCHHFACLVLTIEVYASDIFKSSMALILTQQANFVEVIELFVLLQSNFAACVCLDVATGLLGANIVKLLCSTQVMEDFTKCSKFCSWSFFLQIPIAQNDANLTDSVTRFGKIWKSLPSFEVQFGILQKFQPTSQGKFSLF